MAPTEEYAALRERAFTFVSGQEEAVGEADLLAHVYGAPIPSSLAATLVRPLLEDLRLFRRDDGAWHCAHPPSPQPGNGPACIALALAATGPHPARHRLIGIAALQIHLDAPQLPRPGSAFHVRLNPEARVPRYAARRGRLDRELFEQEPLFTDVVDDFFAFLGNLPVCAQEVDQAWSYVCHEARRVGRTPPQPRLLDVNRLADRLLRLPTKPTLALVADALGQPCGPIADTAAEAGAVGRVMVALAARARERDVSSLDDLVALQARPVAPRPLSNPATAHNFPEAPGVYVMRDSEGEALYVGKGRHLRRRVAAYVQRPLGVTRRFEGLVDGVQALETRTCDNELEALVLEAREIRTLRPRFNTQREQHPPRYWLSLPPLPPPAKGRSRRAPRRIMLCEVPGEQSLGPYRNERLAEHARSLARQLFDLDAARKVRSADYEARLAGAWEFLAGNLEPALTRLRDDLTAAHAARDLARATRQERLLRECLAYTPHALLLPADPRLTRYAVVRPDPRGVEGFVLDRARLVSYARIDELDPASLASFAERLLAAQEPRTASEDTPVVLRWLGAQRPSARLVLLSNDAEDGLARVTEAASDVAGDMLARESANRPVDPMDDD